MNQVKQIVLMLVFIFLCYTSMELAIEAGDHYILTGEYTNVGWLIGVWILISFNVGAMYSLTIKAWRTEHEPD